MNSSAVGVLNVPDARLSAGLPLAHFQEHTMNDNSTTGGVGLLLGIVLVLLLLVGGAGFYLLMERQQKAVAVERARAAEAEAGAQVERARALAARASRRSADDAPSTTDGDDEIRAAVEAVLAAQQEAWNRGDVDAFVDHYWHSNDVTFSSGGKMTRGWEETVRGYRERYPTRADMGRLTFSNLEITPLGDSAALVLGQWRLERDNEPLSGNFSLVFRKLDGRWVIVHDHTSRVVD
jgi:uncharacterized protein (TIGR02246 family)